MITEIIDHAIDLTGSEDKSVLVNYTLPSGDWTISIEAKGPITASEWGNLFQTTGSNPLYVLDSQKSGSNPREYGTSSVSNTFFQIPVLDALGQDDWVTITITKSGDLLTYYVNENSYGTVTYSSIPDSYTIGSINGTNLNGSTNDHLFADVANFRVFEGAATEEEVLDLLVDPTANTDGDTLLDGEDSHPDDFGMPQMQEPAPQLKLSDDDWAALPEDKTSPYQTDIHGADLSLGQIFEIDRSQIGGGYDSQALGIKIRDAENNFVGLIDFTDRGYTASSIRYVLSNSETSGFLTGYNGTAPSGDDTQVIINESLLSSVRSVLTSHFSIDVNNIPGYEIAVTLKFFHDGREDEEGVSGASYPRGLFYIRPEMILEGYSEESPDTSNEDDSDSDNGENETQPMEEIIMSYDFTKDKAGTLTPTISSPDDGAVQAYETVAQGAETPSTDGCRTKKFLSVLEAKGLKLCGDLVMGPGAQVYLQDGTAADSLVKDISFAYGQFNNSGDFVFADPATDTAGSATVMAEPIVEGDAATITNEMGIPQVVLDDTGATAGALAPTGAIHGNKWFMMVTRPDGSKEFKSMPMVDDLFDAVGTNGKIVSILGAIQEVENLQEVVKAALDAERLATRDQLEALEESTQASLTALVQFMEQLENALVGHMNDGDAEVMAHVDARFNLLAASLVSFENDTRFHGSANLESIEGDADCETGGTFTLAGLPSKATDIKHWMIEVAIQDSLGATAKRRGDIELEYELQFDGGDMKVTTHIAGCGEEAVSGFLVCNAIYCGDVDATDLPSGSDGTLLNAYVRAQDLKIVALEESESAANPFIDQDSSTPGHQPGQAVKKVDLV